MIVGLVVDFGAAGVDLVQVKNLEESIIVEILQDRRDDYRFNKAKKRGEEKTASSIRSRVLWKDLQRSRSISVDEK